MRTGRIFTAAVALLTLAAATAGCSHRSGGSRSRTVLETEVDSVAYVLGMNIGRTLWQTDSTLRIEALCAGIRDCFARSEKFSEEEARTLFLQYLHVSRPEQIRAYEERFLEEIVLKNRSFARTKSGVTYTVGEVGDEKQSPKNDVDTVSIRYVASTADGAVFYSSFERGDTARMVLSALPEGMRESLKLIGAGGRITAYVPAALGYGAEGNDSLGVKPNATLCYEIDLLGVETGDNRRSFTPRR